MSHTTRATLFLMLAALSATTACSSSDQPQQSSEAQAPVQARAPVAPPEKTTTTHVLKRPAPAVKIDFASSGSLGGSDALYGVFHLRTDKEVRDLTLHVRPRSNATVRDVALNAWHPEGNGAAVTVDRIAAHDDEWVVVAFDPHGEDTTRLDASASYRIAGGDGLTNLRPQDWSVTQGLLDGDTLARVRWAYSYQSIHQAKKLIADKKYDDAEALLLSEHDANVEVGLALRVTPKLEGVEDTIDDLQAKIAEARKPKPHHKRPPKRKIQILRVVK